MRTNLTLVQPTGVWTNAFTYDSANRLKTVASPAGTFTNYYDEPSTRLTRLSLPSGAYVYNQFDSMSRLTSTFLHNSSDAPLDGYVYQYDRENQRTNEVRADSSTVGYQYDNIGQLTVADSSVPSEDRGYTYDAAWNLNWRTNNGAASQFKVNVLNELTNAPSPVGNQNYDSNGNLTTNHPGLQGKKWIYTYDDENRLVELIRTNGTADITVSDFIYDGLGRLRERLEYVPSIGSSPVGNWTLHSETHYIYDGWRVIQERDGSNTPTVSYTRGNDLSVSLEGAGGIGGLLARSAGSNAYYFADGNGNITALIDGSQNVVASYRYDPFGNIISKSGTLADANVYRFSSKEVHVNSGMYYYGFRFYDPNLQRWINRDPIEEEGGYNLFEFVLNNPDGYYDPYGELPPSSPVCQALQRKIDNLREEVAKRTRDLHDDPQKLPGRAPNDNQRPSLSRWGHQKLLNMAKANLAAKEALYQAKCTDPEHPIGNALNSLASGIPGTPAQLEAAGEIAADIGTVASALAGLLEGVGGEMGLPPGPRASQQPATAPQPQGVPVPVPAH